MAAKRNDIQIGIGESTEPVVKEERTANCTQFIYIGPALPDGKLKANTIFNNNFSEIREYCKEIIEQYPQITHLIVPVNKLSEYKSKTQAHGNILNKYYNDIVSVMSTKER